MDNDKGTMFIVALIGGCFLLLIIYSIIHALLKDDVADELARLVIQRRKGSPYFEKRYFLSVVKYIKSDRRLADITKHEIVALAEEITRDMLFCNNHRKFFAWSLRFKETYAMCKEQFLGLDKEERKNFVKFMNI